MYKYLMHEAPFKIHGQSIVISGPVRVQCVTNYRTLLCREAYIHTHTSVHNSSVMHWRTCSLTICMYIHASRFLLPERYDVEMWCWYLRRDWDLVFCCLVCCFFLSVINIVGLQSKRGRKKSSLIHLYIIPRGQTGDRTWDCTMVYFNLVCTSTLPLLFQPHSPPIDSTFPHCTVPLFTYKLNPLLYFL